MIVMTNRVTEPQHPENETDSVSRRVLVALLFLLLSFLCVFCSSYSALFFVNRDQIAGGIRAKSQADYGPGVLVLLAPVDRDQIISEIIQDEADLQSTPVLVEAGAASVALLPKITPVEILFTPTSIAAIPTFTPTASPTPEPGERPPSPTKPPVGPTSTTAPTQPSPTPVPSTPQPPTLTPPPTATSVPLPPTNTPTVTPVPPTSTPTATPVPPTNTPPPPPPTNAPPSVGDDTATVAEGSSIVINVLANDSDNDGLLVVGSLTVTINPAHGTAVVNSSTGQITYTPSANYNGTDTFQYRICDNDGACSLGSVTVTITPVNTAPVAVDDFLSLPEDTPTTLNVLANDSDVDGPTLFISAVGLPAVGSVVNNSTNLFYTPPPDYFGPDVFTYTVSDGLLTDTATVSLTVTPVNDPPIARPDTAFTAEDTSESIDVLANDSDVDGDVLTIISVSTPANGTTTTNGRVVLYFPNLNFDGTDIFTYVISDGLVTATTTVTVNIVAINDPPVAAADTYSMAANTVLSQPAPGVLANDTDVDSPTLQAILVGGPSSGSLTLNSNGSFTYTPTLNFTGVVTFTYQANDGSASSSPATVTINVN